MSQKMIYIYACNILKIPQTPKPSLPALRKHYRALSLKYHPDKNPGSETAHDHFIHISEAYHFLMDDSNLHIHSPILEKYNDLLYSFLKSILNRSEECNEKIYSIIRQMLTLCEQKSIKLLSNK